MSSPSNQTPRALVSHKDRAALARQAQALAAERNDDEGSPAWRAAVAAWVGNDTQWWEVKTEGELHERARALGLLD